MQNVNPIHQISVAVEALRRRRAAGNATPDDAIALARATESLLASIDDAEKRTLAATAIASEMLNTLVFSINDTRHNTARTLAASLAAIEHIDRLPVESEFAERRYRPQREVIMRLSGHIDSLKRRHARRHNLWALALRLITAVFAVIFTMIICRAAGSGTDTMIGAALIAAGAMCPFVLAKASTDGSSRRRWKVASAIGTLVLVGLGIALIHYEGRHRERTQLDALIADRDEDGLMAYLADSSNTFYTDEALDAYLALMDSIFFDPSLMEKPSQMPPLARMESFSRNTDLPAAVRDVLTQRVTERTDSLYRLTAGIGTLEAWERYQNLAPGELYYDSPEIIDSLDEVAWSSEATAWQRAAHMDTREGYERYVDTYPAGANVATAKSRLIDYEVNDVRNHSNMVVESIDRICDFDGVGSRISIFNDTDFQITMLFSGPTSTSLLVPANGNAETIVADGSYQVLVRVANPTRDRFTFSQNFSRGLYSSTIAFSDKSEKQ